MIILGIDPGSRFCGYGIIEVHKRQIIAAGCDVIKISPKLKLSEKLVLIHSEITKIVLEYKPDLSAVESIFYGKNIKSAFTLGHVRGTILLALAQNKLLIEEYSPREVKKAVVGNGNASKEQIKYMLEKILKVDLNNKSEDATDALAVAICAFNKIKYTLKI
ncbi:MAG: crossover junction endodeoxyribonuclease RuvC [Candidatus Cloacimonetes bacterium]|nr:crossover junction endodeoxyribonuclease RuvC [Candidatus Cloacimonadota bacterium]